MQITVENLMMELKGAMDDLFVAKVEKGKKGWSFVFLTDKPLL